MRGDRDSRNSSQGSRSSRRVSERNIKGYIMERRGTEPLGRVVHEEPSPHDAILIMGLSGVGKSTFVSQLVRERIKIGDSLTSCTKDVDGYVYNRPNGRAVYLLDTPGWDDTEKDNISVLQQIAMILHNIANTICLAGVLYLHRISDVRMAGSALKSLRLVEKICGEANFGAVAVATTMWELVEPELAERREQLLVSTPEFFGTLQQGGASITRHLNNADSASDIVESMLQRQNEVVLNIQHEMAYEHKSLADTAAGQYLLSELDQTRARYEKECQQLQEVLEKAAQGDDEDLISMIFEQRKEYEDNIEHTKLAQRHLAVTPEQMKLQQIDWLERRAEEAGTIGHETTEKTAREIELEEQLARVERDSSRALKKLRLEKKGKDMENEQLKKKQRELETLNKQLYEERARRVKRDPHAELGEMMTQSFSTMVRKAMDAWGVDACVVRPLRRALTYPREESVWAKNRGPKLSEPKGRSSSQHRKSRKKKHSRSPLQEDVQDAYQEEDDEYYDNEGPDEALIPYTPPPLISYAAKTPAAAPQKQKLQPSLPNIKFADLNRSVGMAVPTPYPPSTQPR